MFSALCCDWFLIKFYRISWCCALLQAHVRPICMVLWLVERGVQFPPRCPPRPECTHPSSGLQLLYIIVIIAAKNLSKISCTLWSSSTRLSCVFMMRTTSESSWSFPCHSYLQLQTFEQITKHSHSETYTEVTPGMILAHAATFFSMATLKHHSIWSHWCKSSLFIYLFYLF